MRGHDRPTRKGNDDAAPPGSSRDALMWLNRFLTGDVLSTLISSRSTLMTQTLQS